MMKSPLCGVLAKASWVITALASINVGLSLLGMNLFMMPLFQTTLAMLMMPLHLVIGLAGVFSLVHFFTNSSCN